MDKKGYITLIAAIFITGLVIAACCGGTTTTTTTKTGQQKAKVYKVGETIKYGETEMVVNSYRSWEGDEFNKPGEGNLYYIVNVTFKNLSNNTQNYSTLMEMNLKDNKGQKYNPEVVSSDEVKAAPEGSVPPGSSLTGEVVFKISKEASGLQFQFSGGIAGEPILVDLKTD